MFITFVMVGIICGGCDFYYRNMPFVSIPTQTISGPITIGSEWIEIIPPEPLRPIVNYQWISLGFYGENKGDFTDQNQKDTALILQDGRKNRIEAFLFDDKGESYELQIVGRGGGIILRRKGEVREENGRFYYSSVNFPTDRVYTKLKIKSEIPLACDKIEWIGSKPQ